MAQVNYAKFRAMGKNASSFQELLARPNKPEPKPKGTTLTKACSDGKHYKVYLYPLSM